MQDYQDLQKLYALAEIEENCVDVNFAYAFISAMAASELELSQWMPMLFINDSGSLSSQEIASDFAQAVLAIYENSHQKLQQQIPLYLPIIENVSEENESLSQYANGYLQALMLIDNIQVLRFPDGSTEDNLQQTCLLLLDKLASFKTNDPQKLALFKQLPTNEEIVSLLPTLLSRYGMQCLLLTGDCE
jgi:uncharacterized protein YecA (UPF0149 family)